jgi:hypothetical protein
MEFVFGRRSWGVVLSLGTFIGMTVNLLGCNLLDCFV